MDTAGSGRRSSLTGDIQIGLWVSEKCRLGPVAGTLGLFVTAASILTLTDTHTQINAKLPL